FIAQKSTIVIRAQQKNIGSAARQKINPISEGDGSQHDPYAPLSSPEFAAVVPSPRLRLQEIVCITRPHERRRLSYASAVEVLFLQLRSPFYRLCMGWENLHLSPPFATTPVRLDEL
ncbi:unnamed protein product, partial [Ectocarpus sp. 12 AP-2014]